MPRLVCSHVFVFVPLRTALLTTHDTCSHLPLPLLGPIPTPCPTGNPKYHLLPAATAQLCASPPHCRPRPSPRPTPNRQPRGPPLPSPAAHAQPAAPRSTGCPHRLPPAARWTAGQLPASSSPWDRCLRSKAHSGSCLLCSHCAHTVLILCSQETTPSERGDGARQGRAERSKKCVDSFGAPSTKGELHTDRATRGKHTVGIGS